ncbi:MAG: GNAT family N-acetyltransferase [Balneolaceae bacterium]
MDAKLQVFTDELMISPICDFTYRWALNCGLSESGALRFSVAMSELVTNIILFAFPHDRKKKFEIEFYHTFSNVEIVIRELGEPFDPDRHIYNIEKALAKDDFDGAGFLLMRSFSDEFTFINRGREGKEFRVSKNIQIHDIDELLQQSLEQREAEIEHTIEPSPQKKLDGFTVHRIKATDAEDISKLIYRTYRYTYNKEDMYLPKKIEEAVLSKDKFGVIARKKDGKAIGYFAITPKYNSNIAEVGEAVVSPSYRRNGVMSKMMNHLIEIANSKQITALFGQAVTTHPVSQKVNHKFGFKTTALQLASSLNVKFMGFNEEYPQFVSIAFDFLPINQPPKKSIYLPKKYKDILLETYDELEMKVEAIEPDSYHLADFSEIDVKINYSSSSSLIIVNKYGKDFFTVLSEMVESLELKNPKTLFLDLPIQNKATPEQFSNISSLGFIYCGLFPHFHKNSDFLRLQKVYTKLDFEIIDILSDFGKKIKMFISDEYYKHI